MVGFHFPLVCMLRCVLCSRSLCCSLSCFCSSGTRHRPGNVFVAGHPHIWQKTDKLLINLTYCVWFLWARSQGHSHKIYVIIERARPHISPTPYSYTQPTAQDLQLRQLDDYHPPRQPPRRILSQLVANYGPC